MQEATPESAVVILFVDDEPSILSALRRLFRPHGYKVLMADNGAAGLALMALEPVDLVISDMRMPEMDGVQFLEQVRARWPEVVRIMLTGYADISSTIDAINRGEIHRYIAKPWDDQDILLSVSDGLKRQALERENRRLVELTQEQNLKLQEANAQLLELNTQLQGANAQLHGVNDELELRVKARTLELEQSNDQLGQANQALGAANLQLEENFALSISVFSGLLELRDGSVSGHGHRVADLALRIAGKLGLDARQETDIYNAGLLHEVGKIGLPDHLLQKNVALMTGQEFELYKLHPQHAQAALLPLGRLQQSAQIIRSQYERIDGKGFPDGLSGAELPLGAQIINLAATYESLISGRLAEKVFSTEEAAAAVHEGLASRYEQAVLDAFDAVLVELTAEANADVELPSSELKSGMVLSRPFLSPLGKVLLPAAFKFTPPVIKQVQEFEQKHEHPFSFFVRKPPDPKRSGGGRS